MNEVNCPIINERTRGLLISPRIPKRRLVNNIIKAFKIIPIETTDTLSIFKKYCLNDSLAILEQATRHTNKTPELFRKSLKKKLPNIEKEVNKKRAEELAAKNTPPAEETEVAEETTTEVTERPDAEESVDAAAQVEEEKKEEAPTPAETVAKEEESGKEDSATDENKEEKKD